MLEIDRRNMLSAKDAHETELSTMKSEKNDLLQRVHDAEIRQMANKYKLDKIADAVCALAKYHVQC